VILGVGALNSKFVENEVLVFGHRGARGLAPENTLAGFETALDMGIDGVELDVLTCSSGETVVFHDYRLDILAGGLGWVERTSLRDLKKRDVGAHFDPRYRGERIPTLDEVIDLVGDRLILNIELKGEYANSDGLESKVVESVRKKGLVDSVIISSFNPVRVARVMEIAPEVKTGMLIQNDVAGWMRRFWFASVVGVDAIHPEIGMISERLVRKWHRKSKTVIAWPANTRADMEMLITAGVDGIITDRPDRLMNILGRVDEERN